MNITSKNLLKIASLLIFAFIQNPTVYAKASFSADTGVLSISRLDAPGVGSFGVDMKLIDPTAFIFEIQGLVGEAEGDFDAHFDKSNGMLGIPVVEVIDENGNKKGLKADLQLIEGTEPIRFKVVNAVSSIEEARILYTRGNTLTTYAGPGGLPGQSAFFPISYQTDFTFLLSGDLQVNTFELSLMFSSTEPATVIADIFIRYASNEEFTRSDLLNPEKAIKIGSTSIPVTSSSFINFSEYKAVINGAVPKTELGDTLVLRLTKAGGQDNQNKELKMQTTSNAKAASSISMH